MLVIVVDKYKLLVSFDFIGIVVYCNERKMVSWNVKEVSDKFYLWVMLKKKGVSGLSYCLNCGCGLFIEFVSYNEFNSNDFCWFFRNCVVIVFWLKLGVCSVDWYVGFFC